MKKSMKYKRFAGNIAAECALIILSVIWLILIVWIVLQAFRKEPVQKRETDRENRTDRCLRAIKQNAIKTDDTPAKGCGKGIGGKRDLL